jgi:hypothetical protein
MNESNKLDNILEETDKVRKNLNDIHDILFTTHELTQISIENLQKIYTYLIDSLNIIKKVVNLLATNKNELLKNVNETEKKNKLEFNKQTSLSVYYTSVSLFNLYHIISIYNLDNTYFTKDINDLTQLLQFLIDLCKSDSPINMDDLQKISTIPTNDLTTIITKPLEINEDEINVINNAITILIQQTEQLINSKQYTNIVLNIAIIIELYITIQYIQTQLKKKSTDSSLSDKIIKIVQSVITILTEEFSEIKQILIKIVGFLPNLTTNELETELKELQKKIKELKQQTTNTLIELPLNNFKSDKSKLIPVPSNPAPSNPAPSNPALSNPAPSNPAPSNPAPSNPAPSNPAPSNPAPAPTTPVPILTDIIEKDLKEIIKDFNYIIQLNNFYDIIDDTNGDNYKFNLCYMLINNIKIPNTDKHIFNINEKFNFFCNNESYILKDILFNIQNIHEKTYNLFNNIVNTYKIENKSRHNSIIIKLILCFYIYSMK